jgi:hypothetical protein
MRSPERSKHAEIGGKLGPLAIAERLKAHRTSWYPTWYPPSASPETAAIPLAIGVSPGGRA